MAQAYYVDDRTQTASRSALTLTYDDRRLQNRKLHSFRSRQVIPLTPDQIWVVRSGVVQLGTLHLSGDETMLGLACPGTAFGLAWSFVSPYHAIAMTDVIAQSYTLEDLEQSPAIAQELLLSISHRLRQSEALLAMSGCRRIEERLRQLLLLLKTEMGQPTNRGTRISVKLTHQHIASAIGTTRVTVTRLLGSLKQEGWLELDDRRYIVIPHSSALPL